MEWKWAKANEKELAKFVNEEVKQLLPGLPVDPLECNKNAKGRRKLIKAIYQTLMGQDIRYAYEKYQPEDEIQQIRTPTEILKQPKEGTCLDLSILFCGLCFAYDLLPLLIVIDGHALAAVSLKHPRNKWNSNDSLRNPFDTSELFQGQDNWERLTAWIEDEAYLAIECTGFAHTKLFTGEQPEEKERQADGTLSFDRACEAGEEQLSNCNRPFKFAIDIATAKYSWKMESLPIPNLNAAEVNAQAVFNLDVEELQSGEMRGVKADRVTSDRDIEANVKLKKGSQVTIIGGEFCEL